MSYRAMLNELLFTKTGNIWFRPDGATCHKVEAIIDVLGCIANLRFDTCRIYLEFYGWYHSLRELWVIFMIRAVKAKSYNIFSTSLHLFILYFKDFRSQIPIKSAFNSTFCVLNVLITPLTKANIQLSNFRDFEIWSNQVFPWRRV